MTVRWRSVVCVAAVLQACGDAPAGSTPGADVAEAGADVAPEAMPDVAPDVTPDAGLDVAEDAPPDAPLDAAPDVAEDVASDATLDGVPDAAPDAPADDISVDAPVDAASDGASTDDAAEIGLDAAPDVALDAAEDLAPDAVLDATDGALDDVAPDAMPGDVAPDATPVDVAPDACAAGLSRCGDVCVDLASAPAHCGACGNGCSAATLGTDRCVAGRCAARSCAAIRGADARAADGVYLLDLDGPGPLEARSFYCDMTGGGWTLVENQVPSEPLPDETATVNPAAFGRVDASWRLGVPDILAVRPAAAWKLTDAANAVYFRPACVVDWRINYTEVMTPSDCTTGYTTEGFTSAVNGGWIYCSARGIGVNNSGRSCSLRGSEGGPAAQGAGPHGRAYSCNYSSTAERVSLWFR